tara:strand:- start:16 stop:204 length:189 start_codon:yes stop_codon:yes gene_type:complete
LDPFFEFLEIHGRQVRQVGAKFNGSLYVNVLNVRLRVVGIPVKQDTDAVWQRSWNVDFMRAN